MKIVNTSGKRKRAIARAKVTEGKGIIRINNAVLENYNPAFLRMRISEPLILAGDLVSKVNINVKVEGGRVSNQADAVRLAIDKSLVEFHKNKELEKKFLEYDRHLLIADVRRKEEKKPNTHGKARAKTQKSYR